MSIRALLAIAFGAVLAVALTAGLTGLARRGGPAPARSPAAARASSSPSAATTATPSSAPTAAPTAAPAGYDHVVVMVLENHSFESVVGSPEAPYLNSLANGGGLATGYGGVAHPSLPNYLAMLGGSTFGITSDCTRCFQPAPSLPDRLEAAGRTWKAYMEGMPSACYAGSVGLYAQKHDPFVYFDAIRNDPARCSQVVPYEDLATDFAVPSTAPDFAFITPNMCNDGHDCPLSTTDAWLSREVPALMASPAFAGSRSLLVVTFDEGEGGSDRVATVFAGAGVRKGFRSAATHDHYSLLRTIEAIWGLEPLAAGDAAATPMTEFLGATG